MDCFGQIEKKGHTGLKMITALNWEDDRAEEEQVFREEIQRENLPVNNV